MAHDIREGGGNPPSNRLQAGVTADDVGDAIHRSGYPVQTAVAVDLTQSGFAITEEWGFTDESGTKRTLDLLAERFDWVDRPNAYRIRPSLDLLVECKQREMPYIFF